MRFLFFKDMITKPEIQIDLDKVEQYAQVCDNNEEIARALGIAVSTFYAKKAESEAFQEAVKRGRAKANIFVGGKLMEQIREGNTTAIIFYLKSRAGWKEADRHEITGANGKPLEIERRETQLTKEQIDSLIELELKKKA